MLNEFQHSDREEFDGKMCSQDRSVREWIRVASRWSREPPLLPGDERNHCEIIGCAMALQYVANNVARLVPRNSKNHEIYRRVWYLLFFSSCVVLKSPFRKFHFISSETRNLDGDLVTSGMKNSSCLYFAGDDSDQQRRCRQRYEIFGHAGQDDHSNDGRERDEPFLGTFLEFLENFCNPSKDNVRMNLPFGIKLSYNSNRATITVRSVFPSE